MSEDKALFYSSVADKFDELMNPYDLCRRLQVVFDELFLLSEVAGKTLLDVGCGTGWFSQEALKRGARVVSLDISCHIILQARQRVSAKYTAASALCLPLSNGSFDLVVSSEVIEHTPEPRQAVKEMARVLKPGGILAMTCPNRAWKWLIDMSVLLRARPFRGYENFPGFDELEEFIQDSGLLVEQHFGLHPWPFQIKPLWRWSTTLDHKFGKKGWGRVMLNQAVRARKAADT